MNLKEYLEQENITVTALAKKLLMDRSHLSCIVNGKRKPSARLARDIQKATKGKVKASDWIELE